MPRVTCRCGKEILVVPNVRLMSKAIEEHVEEHRKKLGCLKEAKEEAERIRNDLVTKVLRKASEL